jgi:hypothetical protein
LIILAVLIIDDIIAITPLPTLSPLLIIDAITLIHYADIITPH